MNTKDFNRLMGDEGAFHIELIGKQPFTCNIITCGKVADGIVIKDGKTETVIMPENWGMICRDKDVIFTYDESREYYENIQILTDCIICDECMQKVISSL